MDSIYQSWYMHYIIRPLLIVASCTQKNKSLVSVVINRFHAANYSFFWRIYSVTIVQLVSSLQTFVE